MADLVKVTCVYSDGSTRDIEKGWFFQSVEDPDSGEITLSAEMLNISGRELKDIVYGTLQIAQKLGLFSNSDSDGGEE